MHAEYFLQDMAIVMLTAGLTTILCNLLKQPVVLGYILAGFLVGPYTLPMIIGVITGHEAEHGLIHDKQVIETLGETGVVLLLFSLGLEFSLRKISKVGAKALVAGLLEIPLMAWVGYQLGLLLGWSTMDAVFLGAMISISSTTIIIKVLSELKKTGDAFAQIIFGILIIEDIAAIAMIAVLSGVAQTQGAGGVEAGSVIYMLGGLTAFLVTILVVGLIAVPPLFNFIARFHSNEMVLITSLGLCFGVSLLALALDYSVALGAFLIGAVIAETRQIGKIEMLIGPVRDMFSAVFFVTIGMLINPVMLAEHFWAILLISLAVVVGKMVACSFGAFVAGSDQRTSLNVGLGMAQIGEFSFIIAALGVQSGVTSDFLYPVAVAVSIVTTLSAPYRIQNSDRMVDVFERNAPHWITRPLELYQGWVSRFGTGKHHNMAAGLIRVWTTQMGVNFALIAGIFGLAAFVSRHEVSLFGAEGEMSNLTFRLILWMLAMLMSLPLLIATFRKLQAMGLLISEISVSREAAGQQCDTTRRIVANLFLLATSIVLVVATLLLSSIILPSLYLAIVTVPLLIVIAMLLRRSFIQLYARAQVTLFELFEQPPAPRFHEEPVKAMPAMLEEAVLETIDVEPGCTIANKRLRDSSLRRDTGASIVGIEHNGLSVINPGPDEILHAGAKALLLGSPEQLSPARLYFIAGENPIQPART